MPYTRGARRTAWRIALGTWALIAAPAAWLSACDPAAPEVAPDAEIALVGASGAVVPASSTLELEVEVRNGSGDPIADAPVLFVGPDFGTRAGGTFEGASAEQPTYVRARTDAMGRAHARWQGDERTGVYFLDALVETTEARVSFAVTQARASMESTPVDAAAASIRLRDTVADIDASGERRVLGPLLLTPGDRVESAGSPAVDEPTPATEITEPTWFFWIDDAVGTKYAHPTRFVFVSALDDAAAPRVVEADFYPELTMTEGPRAALLTASDLNSVDPLHVADVGAVAAPLDDPSSACAIVISGPSEYYLRADAANARDFFRDELGIPAGQVFSKTTFTGSTRPASLQDLEGFLDLAAESGCTKLFLYITAHGYNGSSNADAQGVNLWEAGADDDTKSHVSYDTIAAEVAERFAGKEVCVIVDACFAGTAVDWFQGRGMRGEVITASSSSLTSGANLLGSYFTDALLDCWEDLLSEDRRSTLRAAFDWVLAEDDDDVTEADPKSGVITEDILPLDVPDVTVMVGQNSVVTVPLPDSFMGPMKRFAPVADVASEGVAGVSTPGFLAPNDMEIIVRGDAEGMVTYTLTLRAGGRAYQGMGTITVTAEETSCREEPAAESAASLSEDAIDDRGDEFLAALVCGFFGIDLWSSNGMSSKAGAGDHTETLGRATRTRSLPQDRVDSLYNMSVFECGVSDVNGTTLCPDGVLPVPAGDVHFVANVLMAPLPLADASNHYQYGFVFDADGDSTNNYQAPPEYPYDFFDGTDRWYVASYDPTNGWTMAVSTAIDGVVTAAPSSARIIIRGQTIALVVPTSEFAVSEPQYRVTAFRHTGNWGLVPPYDWNGDVEPMVADGLSPF